MTNDRFDDVAPGLRAPDRGERWPIAPESGGRAVPDLSRIPRDRWRDALKAAEPAVRRSAAHTVNRLQDVGSVLSLVAELELETAREEARSAPSRAVLDERLAYPEPLPTPEAPERRRRTRERQICFRVSDPVFEELALAARLIDSTPTMLARLLTVRGVRGMLRNET